MDNNSLFQGKCLCGAVRVEIFAEPLWVGHCHCPSCRKATSASYATYAGFKVSSVFFKGEKPKVFESSPGVIRRFCGKCGSPVSFEGETWPDEIHLHVQLLDNASAFTPTGHTYVKTRMPWVSMDDGLEQFEAFSSEDNQP
ncbi:GFA family protein [Kordiimonas pumila]|uniref:GFA family protein n=1 Tax=Kordiimonas pumila TaxID=2161677 RepID=A0ABV7D891_9PROT|nr:GFA family protein [Kordiimonas pumila]